MILESDVKITALAFADRQFEDGARLIAVFDCEIGAIGLRGCSLLKTPKGGFTATPPRGENARDPGRRAVIIKDESLRHAIMQAARKTFMKMGGAGGEWTKREAAE
ncbi:MAG: hypothetical protein AB7K64_02055 [Variibacter sp.]